MFAPLPDKPHHDSLEREVLERWEREATFRVEDGDRYIDAGYKATKEALQ